MSLAGDYGSDLLHCCRHHQPVGVVLALAHFLQLSLAGKFIKKATDVLLKVFYVFDEIFLFFLPFCGFSGKKQDGDCGDKAAAPMCQQVAASRK